MEKLLKLFLDPYPLRTFTKRIIKKFNIGNYEQRLKIGAVERPHYGYIVHKAALLAKQLGYKNMSVLEFGVSEGEGLQNLEQHAEEVSKLFSIKIDIYGFDTGEGLPEPLDYRDLPYHWRKGDYKMDVPKIQARLKSARLVLGDIIETSKTFFDDYDPEPIGAIIFDFDFYSSTTIAMSMLEANEKYYLPRLCCYFDNIFDDFIGERLAINEFNRNHELIKLSPDYSLLLGKKFIEPWSHQVWSWHFFEHSLYNKYVNT